MNIQGLEAFDDVNRLIVVTAHPDDLECACGGIILQLLDRGVEVHLVVCTLGDIGTQDRTISRSQLATTRLTEMQNAADQLGLTSVQNLGHHDGELVPNLELRAQIALLYRTTQADTMFTFDPHWNGQVHPDHRAAGRAAIDAYLPSKMPLYRPEQLGISGAQLGCLERVFVFATDGNADIIVDTAAVHDRKVAACAMHACQFPGGVESLSWLKEMDGSVGSRIGSSSAEAMRTVRVW